VNVTDWSAKMKRALPVKAAGKPADDELVRL
jgi:hypothetical protein